MKKSKQIEFLTLDDVSKLCGLSVETLRWMRGRETITLKSGPPYYKGMDEFGLTVYLYRRDDVLKWLKRKRNFRITASDAAEILRISRYEMIGRFSHGLHSFEGKNGKLTIEVAKNTYIWIPRICIDYYEIPKKKKRIDIPTKLYV